MKMPYFYAYFAIHLCTNIIHLCTNINDFLKLNGQKSMQDVLMVGSCNVSKLVVHALHSNFAMDRLEIWNVKLIFRIKTGGWDNVS